MSKTHYCRNPRIVIDHPFEANQWNRAFGVAPPDDTRKASDLEDTIASIKRHVDDLGWIRVEWDEGEECSFCHAPWVFGNWEYQDGHEWPLCCEDAQRDVAMAYPEWMPSDPEIKVVVDAIWDREISEDKK